MEELIKGDEKAYYYSPEYCVPLLDYVEILSDEYKPLSPMDMECGFGITRGIGTFLYRYFGEKVDTSFKSKFLANNEVLETITAFGYDVDKFWYMLLFAYDYSNGMCFDGIVKGKSPKKSLTELAMAIYENLKSFDDITKTTRFKSPTKIVLDIKGKRKISIEDPVALFYLGSLLLDELDEHDENSVLSQSRKGITLRNREIEGKSTSDAVHIWYLAKMLLKFFELKPPIKGNQKKGSLISFNKKLLISRLIYIVGLSKNESFCDSDDTLKGFLKQYKDLEINTINGYYFF